MIRQKSLKLMLFLVPAILLMAALCVQAAHKGGYISDPSLYWSVGINDVGFTGRTAHSEHRYAVENYSTYDLRVNWEYAHKVMLPNKTVYKDISKHGTVKVKAGQDKYGGGTRSTSVGKGRYYIDAYTSVDILYEKRRPRHPSRIKYGKVSHKTAEQDIL